MDSPLHAVAIVIHVVSGTTALVIGLVQLFTAAGGPRHRQLGRLFSLLTWSVVLTAVLGLVLFEFRAFLAVLTMLVAYWTYSGVRAVRNRDRGPGIQDGIVSVLALVAVVAFCYYLPRVRVPWVPAILYSTLGTLVTVAVYDLTRLLFPKPWLRNMWRYEHAVKMLGAHGAIAAAFSGTVLSGLQPFSQILPSVIWTLLQVGVVIRLRRAAGEVSKRIPWLPTSRLMPARPSADTVSVRCAEVRPARNAGRVLPEV